MNTTATPAPYRERTQAETESIESCLEVLSNVIYLADHAKDFTRAKSYFGHAQSQLDALTTRLLIS
jgi:hypothetical protein